MDNGGAGRCGYPIAEQIRVVIGGFLGFPQSSVTDEAELLRDLRVDSLELVELKMELEEEFGIEIPDDIEGIKCVRDIISFIIERIGVK